MLQNIFYCNNQLILHNYFDGSTKLFSDLYLSKFLDRFYFNKIILFMYSYKFVNVLHKIFLYVLYTFAVLIKVLLSIILQL